MSDERKKKPDEKAKREIRTKMADLAGRMLRPNQRVRKPRGEKPHYPKGT